MIKRIVCPDGIVEFDETILDNPNLESFRIMFEFVGEKSTMNSVFTR
jgi:hypothetical protein